MAIELLAYFPLAAQVGYNVATVKNNVAMVRAKRSDQVSLWSLGLIATLHALYIGWSLGFAHQMGLALGFALAATFALLTLGIAVYYRIYPGGRSQ